MLLKGLAVIDYERYILISVQVKREPHGKE
jgi:hypothetical protein